MILVIDVIHLVLMGETLTVRHSIVPAVATSMCGVLMVAIVDAVTVVRMMVVGTVLWTGDK